jgi:hypothetical protein
MFSHVLGVDGGSVHTIYLFILCEEREREKEREERESESEQRAL